MKRQKSVMYDVWDAIKVGDEFTAGDLRELAGVERTRRNSKTAHNVLTQARRRGELVSTEGRKAGMVVYRRVKPGEASTPVEVHSAPARLVDMPLDYLTLGKAVLKVVEEQAGRITQLKQEVANVRKEAREEAEAAEHYKKMVAELQQRVNALNEKLLTKDKRPVTLGDLQALRNGLPPGKEE